MILVLYVVLMYTRVVLYIASLAAIASVEERNVPKSIPITKARPSAPLFCKRPMGTRWGSSGPIGPHRTVDLMGFCARWSPMGPDGRL